MLLSLYKKVLPKKSSLEKMPKVSIIIATKNEQKNIGRLLKSLKNQSFTNFEIIVIDNFSSDKTVDIAKKYTHKVFQKGPERSTQRNFGLKKAQGQYVLFLDADMSLQKNVISQCYNWMKKNHELSGVIVDEITRGSGFLAKVQALEKEIYRGQELMEAARFFRVSDVRKVASYDEVLIAGEDWDISQRLKKFGKLGHVSAKIHHHASHSILSDLKKKYYYAKYIKDYAKKNQQRFQKQAGFERFSLLFKKPELILEKPFEFTGLLFLKSFQYLAYRAAKFRSR